MFMMEYLEKFFKNRPLSLEKFNSVIGAVILEGLLASLFAAVLFGGVVSLLLKPWLLVVCYIVLCAIGVYISYKSDQPIKSFLGYNIVMIATGTFLKAILKSVTAINLVHIYWIVIGVMAIMFVAAKLMPRVLVKMERAIKVTLVGIVVIGLIALIAGWFKTGWWDAVVAVIVSLYFGFVWGKAYKNELSTDGAVDGCLGLYIGLAELFARITSPASDKAGSIAGKVKKGREKLKNLFQED